MNFRAISILVSALAAGVVVSLFTWPPPAVERPVSLPPPVVDDAPDVDFRITNPSAVKYVPPKDRFDELQLCDKAVLFLLDSQESDGHWSSARTGAAKAFQNLNGDIGLTAIAAYVLMTSSTKDSPNPRAVAAGGKAVRWIESKMNADGTVGELNGPGEQVFSQFLAGAAFMQAAGMSTRESLRKEGQKVIAVSLMKMRAKNGGYGPDMNSVEPRMDVLTWAACICKFASNEGLYFELPQFGGAELPEPKDDKARDARYKAHRAAEDEILNNIRTGLKRLEAAGTSAPEGKSSGVFAQQPGGAADWNATIAGMLANFLISPQRSTVAPSLEFVFGPFDAKSENYPRIAEFVRWGERGEGYRSDVAWFGTFAVSYLFTDDKFQHKTWAGLMRPLLKSHQQPDGGWPVAGDDAQRGRVWRTAMHTLTLIQLAPPPPPPAPPEDTINTPAVPADPPPRAK